MPGSSAMSPRTQRRVEAMGAHPPPGPPRQCRGQQLRGSRGGQLASRQLTVLLAALAPRARAQNCTTADTFVAVGEMTDCGAVLATGGHAAHDHEYGDGAGE